MLLNLVDTDNFRVHLLENTDFLMLTEISFYLEDMERKYIMPGEIFHYKVGAILAKFLV